MDLTTEIASDFVVGRYHELRAQLEVGSATGPAWSELLSAFRRRVEERFLRPIAQLSASTRGAERTVPGFAILALDCLLIDTIQSFREGRVSTGETSPARSFKTFLMRSPFGCFTSEDRNEFFRYVRNGLLHNGETRGDWKVRTDRREMLSKDPATGSRTLNRRLFHEAIAGEFEDYCRELEEGTADVRAPFLRRMDAICGLAPVVGRLYFAYGSNLVEEEMLATAPNASSAGVAFLPGYRLVFTKHSRSRGGDAASIEKCPSRVLWGFLYRISTEEERALSKREGGYEERPIRVWRPDAGVDCEHAAPVDAFTFVGKEPCADICGPTSAYLELVLAGARLRGLPDDYLESIGASP